MPKVRLQPVKNKFLRDVMDKHDIEETKALAEFFEIPESTMRAWIGKESVRATPELILKVAAKLEISPEAAMMGLLGIEQ